MLPSLEVLGEHATETVWRDLAATVQHAFEKVALELIIRAMGRCARRWMCHHACRWHPVVLYFIHLDMCVDMLVIVDVVI